MPSQLHKSVDKIISHLEMIESQDLDRLDFSWKGIPFTAYVENGKASTEITLTGTLGRIYYTAENAAKRKSALSQYYMSRRSKHRPYNLVNKHEIHFKEKTISRNKLDHVGVISAVTYILLALENGLLEFSSNLKSIN
ncbi:hypothetical protein QGN29_11410 [Temperatibacter marinus]|uniref:Uncharacterized protein n=1 Tax=Temperatibacter marinus TaxID=1456591 RepID=A0AA52EGL5_9PROT|nr:hypothetical protein [Temperatibacter marinus]WND02157.1 hypothetical protein QGN29_11410 [Temperatibacter marinus]